MPPNVGKMKPLKELKVCRIWGFIFSDATSFNYWRLFNYAKVEYCQCKTYKRTWLLRLTASLLKETEWGQSARRKTWSWIGWSTWKLGDWNLALHWTGARKKRIEWKHAHMNNKNPISNRLFVAFRYWNVCPAEFCTNPSLSLHVITQRTVWEV